MWKGKDQVKQLSLVSDYRDGGLSYIESLVKTQRIVPKTIIYHEDYSPEHIEIVL